jgi:hypothetical protein
MKKILFEKLTVKETAAIYGGDTTVTDGCYVTPEEPKGTDCTSPIPLITSAEDCQCPAVPERPCAKGD